MTDASKPQSRSNVKDAALPRMLSAGKGTVILSNLDLTSGLLGTPAWGIQGYQPRYAQDLARNIVLWANSRIQP